MLSQAEKQALRIKLRRLGKAADSPTAAAAAADADHVTVLEGQLAAATLEHQQQVAVLEEQLLDCNRQLSDARANGRQQLEEHYGQQAEGEARREQQHQDLQQQQQDREARDEQRQLSDVRQQLSDVRQELEDARQQAEAARSSEQRLRAHLARSESLHSPLAGSPHLFDQQQRGHQNEKLESEQSRRDLQQLKKHQQLPFETGGRSNPQNLVAPGDSAASEALQDIGSDGSSSLTRSVRPDMSQLQASSRIAAASSAVPANASLTSEGPPADNLAVPSGSEDRRGYSSGGNPQELLRKLLPWRLPPQRSSQSAHSASESSSVAQTREEGAGVSQRASDAITKQVDAIAMLSHMVAALADQKRSNLHAVDILQVHNCMLNDCFGARP